MDVDVRLDVIWRDGGGVETVLATVTHIFPPGDGVAFEADLAGSAAAAQPGEHLIYRFTNISGSGASYTPNGDGALVGARIPSLTLPE